MEEDKNILEKVEAKGLHEIQWSTLNPEQKREIIARYEQRV